MGAKKLAKGRDMFGCHVFGPKILRPPQCDWVLFDATLHKSDKLGPRVRYRLLHKKTAYVLKRYEVRARHLRVLNFIPPAVNASFLIPVVPSPSTGLTSSGAANQGLVGSRKRRKTCRMSTGGKAPR
jgi:hypothetical protein